MSNFTATELKIIRQAMLDGIEATPPEYFQLKAQITNSEAWEQVVRLFQQVPVQLSTQQIATAIEYMKLSVMFVADFEYHARTGYHKEDALAFIVAMETTGQPPTSYPKCLG